MPCTMAIMFLLKITCLMHPSNSFFTEASRCCFIFILQCSKVFIPLEPSFHQFVTNVLAAGPQVFNLPFLPLNFTLLPSSVDKVKVPFFPYEELLLSALAIPPNRLLPLHFGSLHLALLKLPMDLLAWIYSQNLWLISVLQPGHACVWCSLASFSCISSPTLGLIFTFGSSFSWFVVHHALLWTECLSLRNWQHHLRDYFYSAVPVPLGISSLPIFPSSPLLKQC